MLKFAEVENLLEYMEISNNPLMNHVCRGLIEHHESMELCPVCVLSYNITPRRKFIYDLVAEDVPFIVYAYADQHDTYKKIGCKQIFDVDPEIRKKYPHPVSVKINTMIEHQRSLGHNVIFRMDDDLNGFWLETCNESKKYSISINTALHLMQFIKEQYNVDSVCAAHTYLTKWLPSSLNRFYRDSTNVPVIPSVIYCCVLLDTRNVVLPQERSDDQVLSIEKVAKYHKKVGTVPVFVGSSRARSNINNLEASDWINRSQINVFKMYGPKCIDITVGLFRSTPWIWIVPTKNPSSWKIEPVDIPQSAIDKLMNEILPSWKPGDKFNIEKYLLDAANLNKETK